MIAPAALSFLDVERKPAAEFEPMPAIDEPLPEPEPEPAPIAEQNPEPEKPKEPAGPPIFSGEDIAQSICEILTGGLRMLAGTDDGYEYTDDMQEKFGKCIGKMGGSVESPVLGIVLSIGIPTALMGFSAFKEGRAKRAAKRRFRKPENDAYHDYEAAE